MEDTESLGTGYHNGAIRKEIWCGLVSGFVSFGALAIGAIATGGAALGLSGLGGFAVGFLDAGGVAFGWKATQGGIAVTHDIAVGGLVSGKHANDELASAFVADSLFFKLGELMMTPWACRLRSRHRAALLVQSEAFITDVPAAEDHSYIAVIVRHSPS